MVRMRRYLHRPACACVLLVIVAILMGMFGFLGYVIYAPH